MDYRMATVDASANENVVELIKKELEEKEHFRLPGFTLFFVGFEAIGGTEFYINNQKAPIRVPLSGTFVTPYSDSKNLTITSLTFPEGFQGNIYYII